MKNWIILTGFAAICFGNVLCQDDVIIEGLPSDRPLNVAHRGSSGMLPEHTVAAYQLAVDQGADVIECDLAVTKDAKLVCSHDAWLNATTNVASFPEFLDRVKTYTISGQNITDYFTIDFTLEELKRLRKVQSLSYRDQSYNDMFPIATFEEYIAVAKNAQRTIGIYPETKIPPFFNNYLSSFNTTMEDMLLEILESHGYNKKSSPCFLQSFLESSLRYMANRTQLPLVFLTGVTLPDQKLEKLAEICYGIGTSKNTIIRVDPKTNTIAEKTDFVDRAHEYGLKVHAYTFRNEGQFLAWDYGADPYREYEAFMTTGIDGFFTDFPWSLANYFQTCNSATLISPSLTIALILALSNLIFLLWES